MRLLERIEMAAGLPPGTLSPDAIEYVAQEGDVDWVIAPLPNGQWAATDDAEVSPDRVALFSSREAALRAQWIGWLTAHPDYTPDQATDRYGWRASELLGSPRLWEAVEAAYHALDPYHQGEHWPHPIAWDGRPLPEQAADLSERIRAERHVAQDPQEAARWEDLLRRLSAALAATHASLEPR